MSKPQPLSPIASTSAFKDYEADLVAWAEDNAALLRARRLTEIDAEHLAEELEDMGKSERRALGSHLQVLAMHMLKWHFQPERRSRSWRLSILNARHAIDEILTDSPSLRPRAEELLAKGYALARERAIVETGLPDQQFPESCPYKIEQLLDDTFWATDQG